MRVGKGYGYGKTILVGEHFVVSGNHAIAAGISAKTECTIERTKGPDYELADERPATPGYKTEKAEQMKESLQLIFNAMKIDPKKTPFKITLAGDLVAASGVGASAANCAAIARALADEFKLKMSDDEINAVAYQGEMGYHGTPSGIDNTAAVFGGLLWYQKGSPPKFEPIKAKTKAEIVLGDTGIVGNTKELVAGVQARRAKDPGAYDKIFKEAEELAIKARNALETGNLDALASCMNRNHELLRMVGVSHGALEELVQIAREEGAPAAKLTGGGGGGLMIALTPGKSLQQKVAKAMQAKGYRTFEAMVG